MQKWYASNEKQGPKLRKTAIVCAMLSAMSVMAMAQAAQYSVSDITGMETGLEAVKTTADGVTTYQFQAGDRVSASSPNGIYINDANPDEAAIGEMIINHLDLKVNQPDAEATGMSIFTPTRQVKLENTTLHVEGGFLGRGINITDRGSDLQLKGSNLLEVNSTQYALGISVEEITGTAKIVASDLQIDVQGVDQAVGIQLRKGYGGSTAHSDVNIDTLTVNTTVAGTPSWQWSESVGIRVSDASTLNAKQTTIESRLEPSQETIGNSDGFGVHIAGGATASLGDGSILVSGAADGMERNFIGALLQGNDSTLTLGNMSIKALADATQVSADSAAKATHVTGVNVVEGNFSMAAGTITAELKGENGTGDVYGVYNYQGTVNLGQAEKGVDITARKTGNSGTIYGLAVMGNTGIVNYTGGKVLSDGIGAYVGQGSTFNVTGKASIESSSNWSLQNVGGYINVSQGGELFAPLAYNSGSITLDHGGMNLGGLQTAGDNQDSITLKNGSKMLIASYPEETKLGTLSLQKGEDEQSRSVLKIGYKNSAGNFSIHSLTNHGDILVDNATVTATLSALGSEDSRWALQANASLNLKSASQNQLMNQLVVDDTSSATLSSASDGGSTRYEFSKLASAGSITVNNADLVARGEVLGSLDSRWTLQENASLDLAPLDQELSMGTVTIDRTSNMNLGNSANNRYIFNVDNLDNAGSITLNNAMLGTRNKSVGMTDGSGNITLKNSELNAASANEAGLLMGKIEADSQSMLRFDNRKPAPITVGELVGDGMMIGIADVNGTTVNVTKNEATNVTVQADAGNGNGFSSEQAFAEAIAQTVVTGEEKRSVASKVAVAEGDIYGGFSAQVDANGNVILDAVTENKKLAAYRSVQGLSNFVWRHDMNDLTKRMGQLRDAPQGIGAWARLYGSEQEYGAAVTAKNQSVQVGFDTDVANGWKLGGAFTYTDGESDYDNGSADNQSWGLGVYGSWLGEDGKFVDLIAKYTRMDSDFELGTMAGGVNNNALSVSAEFGWHLPLTSNFFVEPQVEATWGKVMGENFTTSNGVRIDQDDFNSVIVRGGVRGGWLLPNQLGNVYARASVVYDFDGEAKSVATKNLGRVEFKDDLGGSWAEYGLGANININETTYTYLDFECTSGGDVKEKWRWNIGLRHTF